MEGNIVEDVDTEDMEDIQVEEVDSKEDNKDGGMEVYKVLDWELMVVLQLFLVLSHSQYRQ